MALFDRLKLARSALNLTLQGVEERTGIGVSTLSELENGKREPRLVQLKQLADLYLRPLGFFLEDGPASFPVVLWGSKPKSPGAEEVQARFVKLAEQYHHLEVLCEVHEPCDLPLHERPVAGFTYAHAEKLAYQIRQLLGLGERPGQALVRVLEEICKVKVFHLDFEPAASAACTLSASFGPAVLLSCRQARGRRHVDLAHELFHLLTWKTLRAADAAGTVEASVLEEELAACFAQNLLLPPESLRVSVEEALAKHAGKLTFDDFLGVARQFDVSVEAVVRQVGFVYQKPASWASAVLEQLGPQIGFWDGRALDTPLLLPLRYLALARQALRNGLLSTGKYAEYTGISRREALQLVEQDARADVQFEVAHA